MDVLLGPTSPEAAFRAGAKTADPLTMYLSDIYTVSVSLAGIPGISIPAGLNSAGLPLAVQLLAGVFQEDKLLRVARMIELGLGAEELVPPGVFQEE